MKEENNTSFFDPRTLIAVVLVGVTWMGWQAHMQRKYPHQKTAKTSVEETAAEFSDKAGATDVPQAVSGTSENLRDPGQQAQERKAMEGEPEFVERKYTFDNSDLRVVLSSRGMGLVDVELKKYKDRALKPKVMVNNPTGFLPFELNLIGRRQPLEFEIEEIQPGKFVGVAKIGDIEVRKEMEILPDYSIDTHVSVKSSSDAFEGLTVFLSEPVLDIEKGSFLLQQFEHQEFFLAHDGTSERVVIDGATTDNRMFPKAHIVSIGSQYFTQALLDKSPVMPEARTAVDSTTKTALASLDYRVLNRASDFKINYMGYIGPKSQEALAQVSDSMTSIINFGWFNIIASYLLKLMTLLYGVLGNWGLAIVGMTLVVRTLVLPFAMMSFRSMKGMQKIQPELKALREKFKDDPTRLNQEMMGLMKANKVNPMGGCLPTLLQFPVFIALYQVLGQSVELYQAPLGGWIQDLSLKDPFYVLPVLVGIAMFIQMRSTPSTMDPAQQKVMMFLPLVFTVFMIALPSGLNLYILVSTIFGLVQQYYFMRDSSKQVPA